MNHLSECAPVRALAASGVRSCWRPRNLRLAASTALIATLAFAGVARAINLPADFTSEDAVPGAGFVVPVCFTFMPGGRMLVGEKQGRVWVVKNGVKLATPMWQSQNEVLDDVDRGLLDVAVDPNYATNHFVYFLYTVDPDSNGVDSPQDGFGRLVRYQTSAADSNVVNPATRTILFGTGWRDAPIIGSPSHTIGAMRWGADGSLLVTTGDGAQFDFYDGGGLDAQMFGPQKAWPYEDIGAYRSQNLWSMAGKLLRLDPSNGHGYPSNPFWDGVSKSVRSRIWAYGLRNPFRFTVRPGTGSSNPANGDPGSIYIGDVGWATWEEMNVARDGGENFGWPCYEGLGQQFTYQSNFPAHGGCDSTGVYWNPNAVTPPIATWNHTNAELSTPPGILGNTSIGGTFYTGTFYPLAYQGRYLFADYGQSWIKLAVVNSNDQVQQIVDFADDADGPVCLRTDPVSGDLFYVSINTFQVRRIRYTGPIGANTPPVANASGAPTAGVPPMLVNFSSAGTFDLDDDPLTYEWTFGDGDGSTLPNPSHTYTSYGVFNAILTVDDGQGGFDRDTVKVTMAAGASFPSTPVLDTFNRPNGPIGGQWAGVTDGLTIVDSTLASDGSGCSAVFDTAPFGPDQEAYYTVQQVTPNAYEHDIMLKVQGLSYADGHIEVLWDGTQNQLRINTHHPATGWTLRGGPFALTLHDGDQFGARATSDGVVKAYVNGVEVGSADITGWPFYAGGGRVGMTLYTASATRIENYGGGTVIFNTPPSAAITGVADSSFFFEDDTLRFVGLKSDDQDASENLVGQWKLRLVHNNHEHILGEFAGDSAEIVGEDHDDGTGVHYEATYIVTDTGALKDSAIVRVFPEIDLEPSAVTVAYDTITTGYSAIYRFWIHNHGRLKSNVSRWRLVANGNQLAEGDTIVFAQDSVEVRRVLPPTLGAGTYTLRAVVDTLGSVVETIEMNNASVRPLVVISSSTGVEDAPRLLALSSPFPNPTTGRVSLGLDLPRAASVRFLVLDLQGREVWRAEDRSLPPGRSTLEWSGKVDGGRPATPGLYLAQVRVDGVAFQRRIAFVR